MDKGDMLMWFDNDPKIDFLSKLERAVSYYRKKYGKSPNLCLVNPDLEVDLGGDSIKILRDQYILPNHFWVGVSNE